MKATMVTLRHAYFNMLLQENRMSPPITYQVKGDKVDENDTYVTVRYINPMTEIPELIKLEKF